MKRIKNVYIIFAVAVPFILFSAFTLNKGINYINNTYAPQDSSSGYYGGYMMGRGMMGRGMMNGGMMGGYMMGRGYMSGQNGSKNNIDKNGNWVAPSSANNLTNPLQDIARASREGENIFNQQCFTCHGTDGKGDGPAAVSLNPKPANLTSARVQNQSDGAIFWKITNGNSPMPSFKYALTKDQRWELVDYIRELGK